MRRIIIVALFSVTVAASLCAQIISSSEAQARAAARAEIEAKEVENWQRARMEKALLEDRLRQIQNSTYEYRSPTHEEVLAMEADWKAKNPFKYGGTMPDFSKRQIRIEKSEQGTAAPQELLSRIAMLEQRMAQLHAAEKRASPVTQSKSGIRASQKPNSTEAAQSLPEANRTSVVLRKMADGRIVAIIGGKMLSFPNEKEAQAYIEKLNP